MYKLVRTPFRVSLFGGGSDYPEYYKEEGFFRPLNIHISKWNLDPQFHGSYSYRPKGAFGQNPN